MAWSAPLRRLARRAPRAPARFISILFCGSDDVSLPTLRALHAALGAPPPSPGAAAVTGLGVLCPGPRPVGRGQGTAVLPVPAFARAAGLPCLEVPYGVRSLSAPPFGGELSAFLARQRFDLGVVVSFGYLLPSQPLLSALPLGAINLHPSALPRHRGAAPVPHTLLAGDARTAACVIEVHPTRMDAGAVLAQEEVAVPPGIGAPALTAQLAALGAAAVLRTVQHLAAARRGARVQDEALVTLAPKLKPEQGRVSWAGGGGSSGSVTPQRLLRMARAYEGSIGLHCLVSQRQRSEAAGEAAAAASQQQPVLPRLKLIELAEVAGEGGAAVAALLPQGAAPGTLAYEGRSRRLFLACCSPSSTEQQQQQQHPWVELLKVQLETKSVVSGGAFALGRHAKGSGVTVLDVALV